MATRLAQYAHRYRNVRLERGDGILEMQLHSAGGPLKWGAKEGSIHAQLGEAFQLIARDPENRVLIITGTGDAFCDGMDFAELPSPEEAGLAQRLIREGQDLLMNLLDIEIPVIGAINGPAYIHAEIPLLSDIVLASDTAVLSDQAHFVHGVVPGDGVQVVWPLLLGPNRGRHFLMTGQFISAQEALALGVVGEVLPAARLRERARELAAGMAAKPMSVLRNTRVALTRPLRKRLADELGYGLMLEFDAIAGAARR